MTIHLHQREIDRLLIALDNIEKGTIAIRTILVDGATTKAVETDEILSLDLDVSHIQFLQKERKPAGLNASWGWTFAYTEDGDYYPEIKDLVQALEQYGKIRIGDHEYSLGGRERNLLQMKRIKK